MRRIKFIFFLLVSIFFSSCASLKNDYNFVGMSRKDLIKKYLNKADSVNPATGKPCIMIGVDSGYVYFENKEKLMNDAYVMHRNRWIIKTGFRKNFLRTKAYYYDVTFKDDIVISQKIGWISDLWKSNYIFKGEESGAVNYICPTDHNNPYAMLMLLKRKGILEWIS